MPKSAFAAIALFLSMRARLSLRGLASKERSEAEIPRDELTRLDACADVGSLLGPFQALRALGLQTKGLLYALDAGEPVRLSRALAIDAAFLAARGRRDEAKWKAPLARAREIADRLGTEHAEGVVVGAEALIHHMTGDWAPSQAKAERSIAMLGRHSLGAVWDVRTAQMVLLWSLTWTGRLSQLKRELDTFLQNAEARGDLYAATSMASGPAGALASLMDDDPATARKTAQEAAARWTHSRYSNQHYWSFFAESQAELYVGRGEAVWQKFAEHWPRMKRALILEVQIIRLEALFFRARAALVTAAEQPHLETAMLRAAASDARAIRGDDAPYAAPMSGLIMASIAATKGDRAQAIALLGEALSVFAARGMQLYRESARWRLGQMIGGEEGAARVAEAEGWARGETVKNPARMLALMAPGFSSSANARPRLARGQKR